MPTVTPPAAPTLPSSPDPTNRSTFNALAYAWSMSLSQFSQGLRALAVNAKANADDAATSAANASASAMPAMMMAAEAATSAANASASATTATISASAAATSATSAAASAATATTKEAEASTSATNASASAATATTSASAAATSATSAAASATAATSKAAEAAASADAAASVSGATLWAANLAYAKGDFVWSPTTGMTYRRTGPAGGGGADPSADASNWTPITATPSPLGYKLITVPDAKTLDSLAGVPLQVFYSATPIVTDGTLVRDLIKDSIVVGKVYHKTSSEVPIALVSIVSSSSSVAIVADSGSVSVNGSAGIDTVYVNAGTVVDASNLSAGVDVVYMPGAWANYSKTILLSKIQFKGVSNGHTEVVTVALGNATIYDRIIFADGAVTTINAKNALTDLNVAITAITGYDATTTTPTTPPADAFHVSGPVPANWLWADGRSVSRANWPGLSAALTASAAYAGDGSTTFTTPAIDPTDKTLTPRSGVAGVFAFIKGF
jgi:hypothetical protein